MDPDDAPDDPVVAARVIDARPDAGDPVLRAFRHARVLASMFGEAPAVSVGRYRLVKQLGRGAGGSVFVADDPELHREVALKLIRCVSRAHRERALAEARVLARMSHPNIVPVHDVGETDEHVYLVMELLRGATLRGFATADRSARAIVAAYRQAASGLAAAHAVGIVHCDFKPDNAMLGDDGRLRVVDFGLAASGEHAIAGGTPRYMAPEQRAGGAADAAMDQYAVGASLREALGDRMPAWLGRVVARASATAPADRYPTMLALEHALANDPRRRWTRRALIAAPVALAAVGFGVGRGATSDAPDRCGGAVEALASAWTPARSVAMIARIEHLDAPFAIAVAPWLRARVGDLAERWLTSHRASCAAHARGELTDELYDRATVCLARARIGLTEAMQLFERAGSDQLPGAITGLAAIERADRCADPAALADLAGSQPSPARRVIDIEIETAAVHVRASTGSAVALAEHAVSSARAAGTPSLTARALLVFGRARQGLSLRTAIAPLVEALEVAVSSGEDAVAVEAYARLAYARSLIASDLAGEAAVASRVRRAFAMSPAPTAGALDPLDGLELVRLIGQRAGARGAFARALLANNTGAVAAMAGDYPRARARYQEAVALAREVTGADSFELGAATVNLAALTADRDQRRALFASALDSARAAVGPDHPAALTAELQLASDGLEPQLVVAQLRALCPRIARLHPSRSLRCAIELAWQSAALDEPREVEAAARLVPRGAHPLDDLLLDVYAGRTDRRAELAHRASELGTATWSEKVRAADLWLAVAWTADPQRRRDAAGRARDLLDAAIAQTGVAPGLIARRLAFARAMAP